MSENNSQQHITAAQLRQQRENDTETAKRYAEALLAKYPEGSFMHGKTSYLLKDLTALEASAKVYVFDGDNDAFERLAEEIRQTDREYLEVSARLAGGTIVHALLDCRPRRADNKVTVFGHTSTAAVAGLLVHCMDTAYSTTAECVLSLNSYAALTARLVIENRDDALETEYFTIPLGQPIPPSARVASDLKGDLNELIAEVRERNFDAMSNNAQSLIDNNPEGSMARALGEEIRQTVTDLKTPRI